LRVEGVASEDEEAGLANVFGVADAAAGRAAAFKLRDQAGAKGFAAVYPDGFGGWLCG
jgi:hypothetical protein